MLQLKVLIRKIAATIVDRLAAGSLQSEDVSTLDDKAGHNTVKAGGLVTVAVVSSAENPGHGKSSDLFVFKIQIQNSYGFKLIFLTKIKNLFFPEVFCCFWHDIRS